MTLSYLQMKYIACCIFILQYIKKAKNKYYERRKERRKGTREKSRRERDGTNDESSSVQAQVVVEKGQEEKAKAEAQKRKEEDRKGNKDTEEHRTAQDHQVLRRDVHRPAPSMHSGSTNSTRSPVGALRQPPRPPAKLLGRLCSLVLRLPTPATP